MNRLVTTLLSIILVFMARESSAKIIPKRGDYVILKTTFTLPQGLYRVEESRSDGKIIIDNGFGQAKELNSDNYETVVANFTNDSQPQRLLYPGSFTMSPGIYDIQAIGEYNSVVVLNGLSRQKVLNAGSYEREAEKDSAKNVGEQVWYGGGFRMLSGYYDVRAEGINGGIIVLDSLGIQRFLSKTKYSLTQVRFEGTVKNPLKCDASLALLN